MELKEWLKKNQNWITFSLIFLFVIWYRSSNDKSGSTNSIPNNNQKIETPIQPTVLNQQEIEENKIKLEKEEKIRKNEEEKERITGCLVGNVEGSWGTYSFSSNGVFSWEVNTGPYQQYREGTWKYIGGNKVKLNKNWIPRSGTITISKYCEIFGLDF